jgi:hypothetical protein
MTFNQYSGERGDHYWVTFRDNNNQERRERRTEWTPVAGDFQYFFDDLMVVASKGLPDSVVRELEPWPIDQVLPFNQQLLAGYLAQTYDIELDEGWSLARKIIEGAVHAHTRKLIGGDEQRVGHVHTRYNAITYKHLLLPVWMLTYRFNDTPYRVLVNAATGEVQGERPYSWVKILFTVMCVVIALAVVYAIASSR